MKSLKRKLLSLLLAMAMVLTLVPSALADGEWDDGEHNNSDTSHTHSYTIDDTTNSQAATCTAAGRTVKKCSVKIGDNNDQDCPAYKVETVSALGHNYASTYSTSATQHWTECSRCQDKKDVTNHSESSGW